MWKPIILDVECIVCNKSLQKISHNPEEVTRKMGKIVHRRSRTPNWSLDEKKCLLELIKERRAVITKGTNGPTHYEEKDVAWNEILQELASRFGSKFNGSSIKKVKTQWQNMKRIAREEITLNGPELQKYTKQSLEVCNILELVKDGVLKTDAQNSNLNETEKNTNLPSIEIKTERIDEDQPNCSSNSFIDIDQQQEDIQPSLSQSNNSNNFECSSSLSEVTSDIPENEPQEQQEQATEKSNNMKNVAANTEFSYLEEAASNGFSVHRNYQDFLRFTSTERQMKVEVLKEERQVIRAMRETAELNKIIAEQRLKHILWVKKQEMAMYSGEPGSGAGKGGGGGGAIREAGGAFGKMEAAREDEYFYKKQREQLANMKSHLDKEIAFHQEQIKRHEDAIRRHKSTKSEIEEK